ncbi:MAG: phosphatase PAP2 family protein [Deltaproteobacteria bacterium]|nr:phosphatase PAP2 family protein [Deltaproteobacteria bacterium]
MGAIVRFDVWLFHIINGTLSAVWLDPFMLFVTEKFNFTGAIVAAMALVLILGKRKDRMGLVVLVLTVLVADLLCNQFKHLIMRVRPCNALDYARLVAGCRSSFSLPSGHATNIFAAMVFLSMRYGRFKPLFLAIAFAVAYSRVYVGVHYPIDITVGAMLGTIVALCFARLEKFAVAEYTRRREKNRVVVDDIE